MAKVIGAVAIWGASVPLSVDAAPPEARWVQTTNVVLPQAGTAPAFDELRRSIPQANAPGTLQIRVRWRTADPVANPAHTENQFEVVSVRRVNGRLRAERSPQVTTANLVLVSCDKLGTELDWRIIGDPRVVRAEASGPSPTGTLLYYLETDFLVVVPDLPSTALLRVYKVWSDAGRAMLDLVGAVGVP